MFYRVTPGHLLYYRLCYNGECLPRLDAQTPVHTTIKKLTDFLVPPEEHLELEASLAIDSI